MAQERRDGRRCQLRATSYRAHAARDCPGRSVMKTRSAPGTPSSHHMKVAFQVRRAIPLGSVAKAKLRCGQPHL